MPSTTINRGNVLYTMVIQATLTPASVATVTSAEQTFVIPGLQPTDQVSGVFPQFAWTSLTSIVGTRAVAANSLGISFANGTAGTLTPPAGVYYVEVNRPETVLTNAV